MVIIKQMHAYNAFQHAKPAQQEIIYIVQHAV